MPRRQEGVVKQAEPLYDAARSHARGDAAGATARAASPVARHPKRAAVTGGTALLPVSAVPMNRGKRAALPAGLPRRLDALPREEAVDRVPVDAEHAPHAHRV